MSRADDANRLFGAGLEHQRQGRFAAARDCYERGLALAPGHPDATFLLGQLLFEQGGDAAARERGEALMRDALAQRPQAANYWRGLAIQLFNADRFAAAREAFAQAAALCPDDPELGSELATACERAGDTAGAAGQWLRVLQRRPGDAALHLRAGQLLLELGRIEAGAAELERAAQLAPNDPGLQFQCGAAYARAGLTLQACGAYEAALALDPRAPAILVNLANQYAELRRHDLAETFYRRALAAAPDFAAAHFNLGLLLVDLARRHEAEAALAAACRCEPENGLMAAHLLFQRMHLCRWDGLEALAQVVAAAVRADRADIPPFIVLAMPGTTPELQRRAAENHARRLPRVGVPVAPAAPARGGRLRLGYLSSDFKNHATAYLVAEMLEAHDRERFEVFALSYGSDDGSAMRARLVAGVEHFVELAGCTAAEAVTRIAGLGLDLLVDLKGYAEGTRSEWLQARLAPVQINWLGYPGTLGAPWIDVLVADAVVAPPSHQPYFSERLLQLPGCYQPNCRERSVAPRPTRAGEGLPDDAIVLCSFNQTYKIDAAMFSLWLEILRRVPRAVLWLWASNAWAEAALRAAAAEAGIAPQRLVFAEGRPQAEHLARLPLADLGLDTFPCNGHTTTSDALWAGVPVVTLQGEAFAARVASSILAAAGLERLVARDAAGYVERVVALCEDAATRAALRAETEALRAASPLFDASDFARRFEALLQSLVPGR